MACWAGRDGLTARANSARGCRLQVEAVFSAPLRRFLEAGPGYSSRDVEWQPGVPYRLHYFDYQYRGSSFCIWGLTAGEDRVMPARSSVATSSPLWAGSLAL
jgi:hypothetical protein